MSPGEASSAVEGPAPAQIGSLARAVVEAYLAVGEGQRDPRQALIAAATAEGLAESALVVPEGPLLDVFAGVASAEVQRSTRRVLAAGYRARLEELACDSRRDFEERAARAAAGAEACLGLSLVQALEEEGWTAELEGLLDRAVDVAVALCPRTAGPLGEGGWVSAIAAKEEESTAREAILVAALALNVEAGRARRLVRLAEEAGPGLLGFVAHVPEVTDEGVFIALARSQSAAARACAAMALQRAGAGGEALAGAAMADLPPADRARIGAALHVGLHAAGGDAMAVARAMAATWPLGTLVPVRGLQGTVDPACLASFFADLGDAWAPRAPDLALGCREAALELALGLLEGDRPVEVPQEAFGRAAVGVVAAGQGAALAAQLLGAGAAAIEVHGPRLALWAALNLAVARRAGAAARPFYANLVALFARSPGRLLEFGPAAPLLARLRGRLQHAWDGRTGSAILTRLERERAFHDLAEELARIDQGRAPRMGDREPEQTPGPKRAPLLAAVDGVRAGAPSPTGEALRVFTGVEVARRFLSTPLWWLGLRRKGRLEIRRDRVVVEQHSQLLGQDLATTREEILPSRIAFVRRRDRAPVGYLVLGLAILIVLTWIGISVVYDGILIKDAVLVAAGTGAILLGLLIDAVLYQVFRSAKAFSLIELHLHSRRAPIRLQIPRGEVERIEAALASLRIDFAPKNQ
jgi:hypothetical protein